MGRHGGLGNVVGVVFVGSVVSAKWGWDPWWRERL